MPSPFAKLLPEVATTPLVPKRWIEGAQDWIDSPTLERSPTEARLRGFGAGVLEGARQELTSPSGLVGLIGLPYAALPKIKSLSTIATALRGLSKAAPAAPAGLAGAISEVAPAAQTLGEILPEFTPIGGESLYNVGRQAATRVANPMAESAFIRYLRGMGK